MHSIDEIRGLLICRTRRAYDITLITLVLLLFTSSFLSSQTVNFKGRIIDKNNKEPLAFVNVIYGKGNLGTTTNIDGWFTIKTQPGQLTLTVTYIGYEGQTMPVTVPGAKQPFIIELEPLVYNLNEVLVLPGENPANRIMQSVIDNRDMNNPEKLPAFSYLSYSRLHFTFETDNFIKSPKSDTIRITPLQYESLIKKNKKEMLRSFLSKQHIFLMETISKRNYNGPGKNKETVIASKTSGLQQPYIFLLANQFQSFSVYGEEFELGARRYVSPVCNSCTNKYLYIIEDSLFNEAGDTIFIISFRPSRGKNFNGLTGIMHINTNRYAVENISAEPTEQDTIMEMQIQQKYSFVEGKAWFPSELNTNMTLTNLSGVLIDTIPISDTVAIKSKVKFVFAGTGKSYLDSINLNPDFSGIKFNQVEVNMDKKVVLNNPSYFDPYRPDSLTEKDLNTYRFIDSIGKETNLDNKIRILSYALTGYIPFYFVDFDIYRFLAYNSFEGLRLGAGIRTNDKVLKWMSAGGYLAYGFNDYKYKYGYNLRLKQPTPGESYIEFSHSNDVREPGKSDFSPRKNIANSEMFRLFLLDPLDREISDNVSLSFRILKSFTVNLSASENYIYPDTMFNFHSDLSLQSLCCLYRQAGIRIRFLYNEKFTETFFGRLSMGSDYPDVYLSCNYFQPDNGNDFFKLETKITSKINFHFAGITKATIRGGYICGKSPLFLTFNGNGSFMPFSLDAENTFQAMLPYEFFCNQYLSIFLRHNFGHLIFKTGKFKPGIELSHNMGFSSKLNNFNNSNIGSFDKIYLESGIIITNILKISLSGYGLGVFYRYGYYSSGKFSNNIYIKLSLTFNS